MRKWLRETDIVMKMFSLLAAMFLWFFVTSFQNNDTTVTYTSIPVQFRGVSELLNSGLVVTSGQSSTVNIKITGKRDRIALIRKSEIKAVVDVSSIMVPGDYDLQYTVTLDDRTLLFTRITETVNISVDRVISKSVPVVVQTSGNPEDGFETGEMTLSPDAISVKGPEKIINQITQAIVSFDSSGIKADVDTNLPFVLVNESGEKVDTAQITVAEASIRLVMSVFQQGEVPFTVDIMPTDEISADMVELTFEPATIAVTGAPDIVSTLNQINLGSISIKKLLEDDVSELTLPLILPNGVTAKEPITSVKVKIGYKSLVKRQVLILPEHFPQTEGYIIAEPSLTVTVLGTDELVQSLTSESFTLSIAPPQATEGGAQKTTVIVTVEPKDGGISIIGRYSLTLEPVVVVE